MSVSLNISAREAVRFYLLPAAFIALTVLLILFGIMKQNRTDTIAKNIPAPSSLAPPAGEFANGDFDKSPNERRIHHSFFLANGLQVMLVSDNKTLKSAASIAVNVGSGSNPPDRQGLAHYLEHMLFLGTKNYPLADQFQSFIREHGGDYNAYTAYDHTNYFFDIKNDHFEPALARFADFFVAPLFNEEFAERERNVVDSEFDMGLKQDGRIYYAIFKEALNPEHPLTGFSVGNKDTLAGNATELRSDLREFFDRHYLAKTMKLTLYSPASIERMKEWAGSLFAVLPAKEHTSPLKQAPFFTNGSLPALLQFRPVKERRFLDYYFPISAQRPYYRSQPDYYVSRLFDARNPNSLYDMLDKRGWIKDLDGSTDISLPEGSLFNIRTELTEAGEKHIPEITAMVLATARNLRSNGIAKWRFDELQKAEQLDFQYKTPEEALPYVRSLSRRLQLFPTADILSLGVPREYNPQQIADILDAININNMLLVYVSPLAEQKQSQTEKYYLTKYHLRRLNATEQAEYAAENTVNIDPEPANPFLAEHANIKRITAKEAGEDPAALPEKLPINNANAWFKFDDSFGTPRAAIRMHIRPDLPQSDSPSYRMHEYLMLKLIHKKLVPLSHAAGLGGYGYSLSLRPFGLSLRIGGYSAGLKVWAENALREILNVDFEPDLFTRIREDIRLELENRKLDSPSGMTGRLMRITLLTYRHDADTLLKALGQITPESLNEFARNYFARPSLMALAYGNIPRPDATEILVNSFGLFGSTRPLLSSETPEKLIRIYNKGRKTAKTDTTHSDFAVHAHYQGKGDSYGERAKIALLATILQPLFFQKLRTEQELGYIVSAYYQRMMGVPGISFVVQSNRLAATGLVGRMDTFFTESLKFLNQMPSSEFENFKAGLINRLSEPPQSPSEAGGLFFDHLSRGKLAFDEPQRMIATLKPLTKNALTEFHRDFLRPQNSYVFIAEPGSNNSDNKNENENNRKEEAN